MSRLEQIEGQVRDLSVDELKAFRNWFAEFDAALWDRQLEADAASGKLSHLSQRPLRDHEAGQSTPL